MGTSSSLDPWSWKVQVELAGPEVVFPTSESCFSGIVDLALKWRRQTVGIHQYLDPDWYHLWRIVSEHVRGTNLQPCFYIIFFFRYPRGCFFVEFVPSMIAPCHLWLKHMRKSNFGSFYGEVKKHIWNHHRKHLGNAPTQIMHLHEGAAIACKKLSTFHYTPVPLQKTHGITLASLYAPPSDLSQITSTS